MEFLTKEYDITYDNYKYTFQQSLDVSKFLITILSIFIVGLVIKPELAEDVVANISTVILIIIFLIVLGIITVIAQVGILKRRRKCVHRMNYLRSKICETEKIIDLHDRYCEIAGFKRMLKTPNYDKFCTSSWLPLIFSVLVTITLILLLITEMNC